MADKEQQTEVEEAGVEEEEAEEGKQTETQAAVAPTQAKSGELKVMITLNGDSILLGAVMPDCDPAYQSLQGDLAAALQAVPGFVQEARQKWAINPLYPQANLPEPVATTATPARTPATAPAKPKSQPSFF